MSKVIAKAELEAFAKSVYLGIPLAKELGVRFDVATGTSVRLLAPFAPNRNHQQTVFGGSLYAVAVLSAWTLVTRSLSEAGANVDYSVVQDGAIRHLFPVEGDFEAAAFWITPDERERFLRMLKKRGRGRAYVRAEISCGGRVCARFEGRFAAQLNGPWA